MTLKRHFSERLKAWQRPIFFNNTSTKESFSSRTIKNSNAIRRKFLPKFPNQSNQNPDDAPLLLSNISSMFDVNLNVKINIKCIVILFLFRHTT